MVKPRRLLLVTAALSSAALGAACGKQRELPGNPKGAFYDSGMEVAPDAAEDAGTAEPENDE